MITMRNVNMHGVTCSTCPYYHAFDDEEITLLGTFAEDHQISGQCCINPPDVIGDNTNVGYFPTTWKSRACGKHPDFDV